MQKFQLFIFIIQCAICNFNIQHMLNFMTANEQCLSQTFIYLIHCLQSLCVCCVCNGRRICQILKFPPISGFVNVYIDPLCSKAASKFADQYKKKISKKEKNPFIETLKKKTEQNKSQNFLKSRNYKNIGSQA